MTMTIPLSIDPNLIAREPIDDEVVADLRAAMAAARDAAATAQEAVTTIRANKMATDFANARQAHEVAYVHQQRAFKKMDAARERAERAIAQIEEETRAPTAPKDLPSSMLHGEVRAALARMTPDQRSSAIATAIEADDHDSITLVAAVLNGVPATTGLSRAEIELRRHAWRRRRFPQHLARAEQLQKSLRALSNGATSFARFMIELAGDAAAIKLAEQSEQAAQAAIAAARSAAA
jgi:hypothetical protein